MGLDIETLIGKLKKNDFLWSAFKFVKSNRILVKLVSLCLIGLVSIIVTIVSVGITVGFNVKYSGKVIATVENFSVFETARNLAVESVSSDGADAAIKTPKFSLTLTVADKLDNAAKVADAIIENTCDIVSGSSLIINGEAVACVEGVSLNEKLEARRTAFYIENAENSAFFVEDVKVESGYYLKSDMTDNISVDKIIKALDVETVSVIVTDEVIPFSTQKIRTDTQYVGYYKVTTEGLNGLKRKTEQVKSLNGENVVRSELSSTVISEPVTKTITVGTAPVKVAATERAQASSAGFICPIAKGKYTVSSYYGDGRNHKGLDLAAKKGVAIFAAQSGTVTYAGYDGDYGYTVVIDHGNGMKTRYAHASALCVNRGAVVSQGDMIATVGNTGYSTGNHLHFEIIVNGTRVNPAPYIGIR